MSLAPHLEFPAAEQVLVLVDGRRSRTRLVDCLGDEHDVIAGTPDGSWDAVDLCIVDAATYPSVADELAAHREAIDPVHLPVLLALREGDQFERWVTGEHRQVVDDVVSLSAPDELLEGRVQSLMHRRRLSLQLEAQRERFGALASSGSDAIVVADEHGSVVFANEATERVFGRPVAAVEGRSVEWLFAVGDVTEGADPAEQVVWHPDGHEISIEVTTATFESCGDRLAVYVVRDVTERVERERELEQLVDYLEDAQAIADLGTWEYDVRTDEFRLSTRTRDIFGFDRTDELSLETALSPYPPAGREELYATFERAAETDEAVDIELPYETDDGRGWVRLHGRFQYEDGEPILVRGTARDVTDRIERVRELERYEVLIEESMDLNVIVDPDGTFQYLTPSVETILGYEPKELVGENAFSYVHPDDLRTASEAFARTLEEPDARPTVAVRFRRADGSWAVMEATGRNLLDDPYVKGIVVYTRDVTEREARQRDLERYRTIVEAATDPVYALDERGRITLVNEAVVELSGYDRDALLGEHVSLLVDEADVERAQRLIADLRSSDGAARSMELSLSNARGETRQYEVNVSTVSADDAFAGTVGVARDVTELREHERRLSVLDRVLRHNLRNKMNVVLGSAGEVAEHTDDEIVRDRIAAIREAGEELLSLGEAVRQFQGSVDPSSERVLEADLVEHLDTVVEETRLAHPHATVAVEAPSTAPARLPASFELALGELLQNAVVHNDRSAPSVAVTVDVGEDAVVVRVADDGPGLEPIERDALLRGVEGPLEHTSGLGLWLVRWAVNNAGGALNVQDRDPRGTVVELRFPSAAPE